MLTDWFVAPEMRPNLQLEKYARREWPYEQQAFNAAILANDSVYAPFIVLANESLMTGMTGTYVQHMWGGLGSALLIDYIRSAAARGLGFVRAPH